MNRHRHATSGLCVVFSVILLTGVGSSVEAASYPFADDFESGLGNWTADAPWGETTAFYASPAHSATDSPSTFYGVSVDSSLSLASSMDLTAAVAPVLRFRHRYQLEDGHDFGYVETSTDGGASWSAAVASYTGGVSSWVRDQIDLSAVAGYNDVRIRFRIVTDGTVIQDGWYIDDVLVTEAPAAVALAAPTTVTPNTVELSWSASAEPSFAAYRVYRSTNPVFDWRLAALVTEITEVATTAHTDITVTPKTTFYYQVMVLTSDDLHSLSNEVSAATPSGMDYPFLDDGEGVGSAWTADPPWALSSEASFSGSSAWSDSPGGNYGDLIPSQSLTLVGPLDLTSATAPVLSYVHTWEFLNADSGNVEVSTDGGSSWTPLTTFTNGVSGAWLRERHDLDAYTSSNNLFIRFRITTDASAGADGWHVDDISVAESPTVVDPPILDQVTSHSIRLAWPRCNDLLFSHYAIHRSTATGVGIKSTLVTEIHDQDTTSFTDSGLAIDTDYFYRVYAVSPYGTYSPDSAAESTARTGGNPFPFTEDFEGSLESWNLTGSWDTTDTDQHGGSYSLTDSPGTTYSNSSSTQVWTSIDLTGTTWPVLRFWDRFAFADSYDWGFLDVSPDGSSWTRVYTVTSSRVAWAEQAIDLSPWKTSSNLRIRFTMSTNGSGADDGWYLDDLSITEHTGSVVVPFSDGAETGTGNWLPAAWAQSADSPHSGASCFRSTPSGLLMASGRHAMELAGELDLSSATDPQLVYWLRGTVADDGGFAAQVSTNGGVTWSTLPGGSIGQNSSVPSWTRYQFSLASYLQSGIRIRFIITESRYVTGATDIYLDDISIEEMPQAVYLNTPVPHLKSVDLSWNESTLGDFDRYEVYRSTAANVTTANDLVFSSTTSTDTSFTDTGLSIGANYYYRVFTFTSRQVAAPSNERMTTTVPLPMPLVDPMENLDNWDATGTWGPDGASPHGGSFSLNDSPGDVSPLGSTTYILTAVNLTGSSWPVLRFWDRYGMANDWAYLEVSTNGTTWYRIYTATNTRTTWAEQAIDLSQWKTADNLRIRFTVYTGGSGSDDGWYLDDLSIADYSGSVALPFFDGAETGTGNWLPAAWAQSADSPHTGTFCFRSTPSGVLMASGLHAMELAGELDLSSATDPQLVYWLRGTVADDGGFAAQVSTDGGQVWGTLPGGSIGQNSSVPSWTRYQFSLASYLQSGVRIRFIVTQSRYYSLGTDIYLDDLSIEEMPQAVSLAAPVPHLKSVDLSWTESALGDFDRYEVYRSTTANVTTANDLVFSSTTSTDTSLIDTGLSIGVTYYYRVFVFNSRNVATPSNERSATTVPLPIPLVDPMENLDNWDATGTWGPDGTSPHGGSFSLNDFPGDVSPLSSNTYILTAVNLTGSTWPVLRFWDRFAFADTGDWGYLEVSTNGSTWYRIYTTTNTRTAWAEQSIDLSPWKTADNLRIRFTVATNGSGSDDGWYLDDLSITDHSGSVALPFSDGAETGTDNWLTAAWAQSADTPHTGIACFRSTPSGLLRASGQHTMELAGELDLSAANDPQLVYWLRGNVADDGAFAAEVSTDGGVGWATLPGGSIGQNTPIPNWTHYQISLASYPVSNLRVRFRVATSRYITGTTDIYLDDISIEEMPDPVALATPDQVTVSSMRLSWNDLNDPAFTAYALYRSETSTVTTASELVATIVDQATTEFVDPGLQARKTYYYRLYFVDTTHTYSPSNSTSAMTLGAIVPFADDFETDSGVWTFTGEWGPVITAGTGGSTSLGDSPGDFIQSVDAFAVTGVDLTGTTWPILSFSERYDFAGHWGRVEISVNGGSNWTILEGATSDQTDWIHRRFDLSPWKGQPQVWIRFFVDANSGVPADGWHIDDLFIGENPLVGSGGFPFFDGLESGDGAWLNGPWSLTGDDPYAGAAAILDTLNSRLANSEIILTYGDVIDLSAATDPLLTIQVRGNLPNNNWFRTEVSTDQGVTWQNLPDLYLPDNWVSADWLRLQTSLGGYLVPDLRLRFRVYGNYGGDSNLFLDNISIGEQTPGAPTLNSPAWGADEPTVRPVLIVNNAIDYQSDPMTYEYQVFDDSGLTNVIAQVPAVAGGIDTTSWTVDVDLLPDTQYWWRCRATDDSVHTGGWMDTATFFIQLSDHPPTVPVLLSPADGAELPDLNGRLTWLESTDPDADNGDYVAGYRVQVDDDPAFASPEIDVAEITNTLEASGALSVSLTELSGSASLITETRYYWRVNAKDSHGVASDWSAGPAHFVFGTDETAPVCAIISPVDDQTLTDTPIAITGSSTDALSGTDLVEVSTDGGATWAQAVGGETWSHQWWPALSGDYQLSCRALDRAGNQGAETTPITVHAELDRTMTFTEATAFVDETTGTLNITVTLSGARATEVNADLVVSGTAQAGVDFENPPTSVRFFPGQTVLVFPITIIDDAIYEGDETMILELANPNLPDVGFGAVGATTLTIEDDEIYTGPDIFQDGFETGDVSEWSSSTP